MPQVQQFDVKVEGIGRVDYSTGVEVTTEPFISSWQNAYHYYALSPAIPAGGHLALTIPITAYKIVILYDFIATIPSNRLIRLSVETEDMTGATTVILDKMAYQTIVARITKGAYTVNHLWLHVYNYASTPQTQLWVGCSGMYTNLAEFTLNVADLPLVP
jgi:hypothetical protein